MTYSKRKKEKENISDIITNGIKLEQMKSISQSRVAHDRNSSSGLNFNTTPTPHTNNINDIKQNDDENDVNGEHSISLLFDSPITDDGDMNSNDGNGDADVSEQAEGVGVTADMAKMLAVDNINDYHNENESERLDAEAAVTKSGDGKHDGPGFNKKVNEKKYQEWSQKDVLVWLKDSLISNGLSKEKTKSFLKEFSTKYITGGTLDELKNNPQLIDELKSDFGDENKAFGIWIVVKRCIRNIDSPIMGQHDQ